ncbi:MAG: cutinase family protein [Mycobacterium sp.]
MTPTPGAPLPATQDASCPDVQMVVVPGTWESSVTDDPFNPTQFPFALLRNVAGPVAEQGYDLGRLEVFTVPYTAQFRNPFVLDGQMDYNKSRQEGLDATLRTITEMNARCPITSYVIVGFSQGAVIAGDVANQIGTGKGPVAAELVLGVTLIADGRRETGVGVDVPPTPAGQGAEITLHQIPFLSTMGLTMSGSRPGGFGALNDRVNQICADGDLICSAPVEAFDVTNLPETLKVLTGGAGQPVHAMYATPDFWNSGGLSATQWTANWAIDKINTAPERAHG